MLFLFLTVKDKGIFFIIRIKMNEDKTDAYTSVADQ